MFLFGVKHEMERHLQSKREINFTLYEFVPHATTNQIPLNFNKINVIMFPIFSKNSIIITYLHYISSE